MPNDKMIKFDDLKTDCKGMADAVTSLYNNLGLGQVPNDISGKVINDAVQTKLNSTTNPSDKAALQKKLAGNYHNLVADNLDSFISSRSPGPNGSAPNTPTPETNDAIKQQEKFLAKHYESLAKAAEQIQKCNVEIQEKQDSLQKDLKPFRWREVLFGDKGKDELAFWKPKNGGSFGHDPLDAIANFMLTIAETMRQVSKAIREERNIRWKAERKIEKIKEERAYAQEKYDAEKESIDAINQKILTLKNGNNPHAPAQNQPGLEGGQTPPQSPAPASPELNIDTASEVVSIQTLKDRFVDAADEVAHAAETLKHASNALKDALDNNASAEEITRLTDARDVALQDIETKEQVAKEALIELDKGYEAFEQAGIDLSADADPDLTAVAEPNTNPEAATAVVDPSTNPEAAANAATSTASNVNASVQGHSGNAPIPPANASLTARTPANAFLTASTRAKNGPATTPASITDQATPADSSVPIMRK